MVIRFPRALQEGDVVGVTSPSSGVPEVLGPRFDVAVATVRSHGYEVRVGECMDGSGVVSAPAAARAAELQAMLVDPEIRAVIPPWGGEMAIDLIELLDWEAIAAAEPTWMIGYSDISTLITPLTLLTGWASIHGNNLMDTPYATPDGLASWLDIVRLPAGGSVEQISPGVHSKGFVDWVENPDVSTYVLDTPSRWRRLDGGDDELTLRGRLIGGCIETLAPLAGTPFLDTALLRDEGDGLLIYVEAAEDNAASIGRALHGMRLNGFYDGAAGVLVGRTHAPSMPGMTQEEAVLDALSPLGVPILAGVDCGHWAPYMPLVNGALATVEHSAASSRITQELR